MTTPNDDNEQVQFTLLQLEDQVHRIIDAAETRLPTAQWHR